jgi:hypothetical protein
MDRFDWGRYPGEDVEEAIAMFIQRQHFFAQGIKPAQGDGGIDVQVATATGYEVYQIKRFAGTLAPSQKRQIKDSFETLLSHAAKTGMKVEHWYLVTPMQPSSGARDWLETLTEGANFACTWLDITWVDNQAADHPQVLDYFFNGGREELLRTRSLLDQFKNAQRDVERGNTVTPDDMRQTLSGMRPLLERFDPFYHWDFHATKRRMDHSNIKNNALFVAEYEENGGFVTVAVRPVFAEALTQSPIKVTMKVHAPEGSDFAADMKSFHKFGTQVRIPAGSVTGGVSLPGGMSMSFDNAELLLGPSDVAERPLRMSLHAEGSMVPIIQIPIIVYQVGAGPSGKGVHVRGRDDGNVFEFEFRFDIENQHTNFFLTRHPIRGRVAGEVIDGLRFLGAVRPDLSLGLAEPFGPVTDLISPSSTGRDNEDWAGINGLPVLEYVEALVAIQEHVAVQVTVTTDEQPSSVDRKMLPALAAILKGEIVKMPKFDYTITGDWDRPPPKSDSGKYAMGTATTMRFDSNGQRVEGPEYFVGCEQIEIIQWPNATGSSVMKYRAAEGFDTWGSLSEEDVTIEALQRHRAEQEAERS